MFDTDGYPVLDTPLTDMEKECWMIGHALLSSDLVEAQRYFTAVENRTVKVEQAHYKKGRFILCH